MAFNDFAQAIQFGAGLLHGFNKQTDDIRAQHDKQQLELLKLLSSDKSQDVQSIDPGEVVGSQGFFGGGALKTKDGHPAFRSEQQLELLKLLSSDKSQDVQSIDPGEVVGSQGFFGGGALKTKDGHPAF